MEMVKNDPLYAAFTPEVIVAHDERVVQVWRENLERHGVKLPKEGASRRVWIAVLMLVYDNHGRERWIHKDQISDLTRTVLPDVAVDQQVRHLRRDGWNLESHRSTGFHRFYDPFRPHSEHENERMRGVALDGDDFDELRRAFVNRCATCGAKEGEPDPRYGSQDVVRLQRGHRDPAKPGVKENILPQCQFCNRAYRDDFVFDGKGRVHAVASLRPVRRAREKVRRVIYDFLRKEFD